MTIDDNLGPSTDVRSSGVGRAQDVEQQQSTREKAALSREDSASLSALGTELARAIATDSPDEISRVSQLEEAVKSGNFSVPSGEVAEALIASALEETQQAGENPHAPPSV